MAPPSTFLRPTDDEKRAILREKELSAQRKAHLRKEEAKERKAKLEADNRAKKQRAKEAKVEASLPSWDIHPTGRVLVTNYMLSPNVFWGRVDRGQTTSFKYVVSGAFTYDPVRQLWGVKTLAALDVALRMGTFHPIMVEPGDVEYLRAPLDGTHACVFAYGQTGSGKTFTLTGGVSSYNERGIIPRALSASL